MARFSLLFGAHVATGLLCAVLLSGPALADHAGSSEIAQRRLRACVTSGAGGASRSSLSEAVTALRALCRPQIDRAGYAEDRRIVAQNPRASADELAEMQRQARRKLDYDLVVLVHNLTGAKP